jgi:hypothetical protein
MKMLLVMLGTEEKIRLAVELSIKELGIEQNVLVPF